MSNGEFILKHYRKRIIAESFMIMHFNGVVVIDQDTPISTLAKGRDEDIACTYIAMQDAFFMRVAKTWRHSERNKCLAKADC